MDKDGNKLRNKTELPNKPKLEITVDTSGMWFAAVALFVVFAAGIIIYRAAIVPRTVPMRRSNRPAFDRAAPAHSRFWHLGDIARCPS